MFGHISSLSHGLAGGCTFASPLFHMFDDDHDDDDDGGTVMIPVMMHYDFLYHFLSFLLSLFQTRIIAIVRLEPAK